MAFTFDATNKLIILSTGTTSFDLADLWTAWKDWQRLGNAGAARALDTVGGEPIDAAAGTMVPLFLFLLNGWKIRPYEGDHTLTVTGGTLVVSGGGDPFVSTLGDYTVRIRYQQPVQAIGYSTGSTLVDYEQIASVTIAALQAASPVIPVNAIEGSWPTIAEHITSLIAAIQALPIPLSSNVTHFNGHQTIGIGTPEDPVRPT